MNDEVKVDETANFEVTSSDFPEVQETKLEAKEVEKEPEKEITKEPEKEAKKEPEVEKKVEKEVDKKTSDDDTASKDTTADEAKPKGQNKIDKRIGTLVRQREDAKRASEKLERENESLKQQLKDKPKVQSKEPKEADFDTYDEYMDAMDKHQNSSKTEKKPEPKVVEKKEESTTTELTDSQKTAMAVIQEKIQDTEGKAKDFDEVALAKDVDITADMLEALAECDDPAKVMYHLGKNKKLASEIAAKTPAQQMREITQLDLSIKPEKPVILTKAADPIDPVSGSDSQEKSLDDMSYKEFEAKRNKQEKKRDSSW